MKKYPKTLYFSIWGITCATVLMSCSVMEKQPYFRDRGKDYKTSQLIPPLSVPSNFSVQPKTKIYPLPESLVVPLPEASLLPPGFEEEDM